MKGTDQLAQWLPSALISVLQQGSAVPAAAISNAVAIALATTVFMLGMRLSLRLLGGTRDVLTGRSLVRRGDGALGGLRKLAGLGVVALPWYRVAQIPLEGVAPTDLTGQVVGMGLLWATLRAVDHRARWLDLDEGVVRASRGFAIFRRHRLTLNLGQALRTPAGRPVGQLDKLGGRRVVIARAAIAALGPYAGGEPAAEAYLRAVVKKTGGKVSRGAK